MDSGLAPFGAPRNDRARSTHGRWTHPPPGVASHPNKTREDIVKAFQAPALAALLAAAAATSATAADPIKIGVVTPLSGTYAGIGQQVRWGLDLATKEVN